MSAIDAHAALLGRRPPRFQPPPGDLHLVIGPPGDDEESRFRLRSTVDAATRGARVVRLEGDRSAVLYMDEATELHRRDMDAMGHLIAFDSEASAETRSAFHTLAHPLPATPRYPREVVSLQIKGVVFDGKAEPTRYDGIGWRRTYTYARPNGRLAEFLPAEEATGYCTLREAIHEATFARTCCERIHTRSVAFPRPIGCGEFEHVTFNGEPQGFVILGLPRLVPGRERPYLEALRADVAQGRLRATVPYLRARSRALFELHRRGLTLPFRHMGNLSFLGEPAAGVLMHDLGDRRALSEREMVSRDQHLLEAFANLCYLLNPIDIIVPGAPGFEEAYAFHSDHIDELARAVLTGYFGEGAPLPSIDDYEECFHALYATPVAASCHRALDHFRKYCPAARALVEPGPSAGAR